MIGPGPGVCAWARAGNPSAAADVAAMRRTCRRFMVPPNWRADRFKIARSFWRRFARLSVDALTRAERLEGDDGVGVLDTRNDLHLLIDEMADVGVVVDVELDQQVVIAGGGVDLRGDLGFRERVGDGIGLAELAFELNEKGNHRCRLRGQTG